jgi:predicted ATPase
VSPTSFGSKLRDLRERSGLSQEQLAERAGLSTRAVSALERGERQHPYPHTVGALVSALDLSGEARARLEEAVSPRGQRLELPLQPTPLLGREQEMRGIADLLVRSRTRLVTLTGTGGVGKTRLALAAASEVEAGFADGAVLVSLAPLRDPDLVVPTIATSLGIREASQRPVREILHGYLRGRNVLLVLDNFEHLLLAAPEVPALLAAAPGVRVLATSRSPLRVQGEQVRPVPPLEPASAVQLFVERTAQVAPDVQPMDLRAASEICQRLDCLPLAIELAAARVRTLPPAALLARLDQRLVLLAGGPRDVPERQQTLRGTIAWSHELLGAAERTLFRRLAVFSGGWTLDAAAAVAEVDLVTALDLHSELLDASLITRAPTSGEPRFELLETVRAYAEEQLAASGEEDAIRDRHAACYRGLALAAGSGLLGADQPEWLDHLEVEHDNLGAALRRMRQRDEIEDIADTCFALWPFWLIRGHLMEGQVWVDEALGLPGLLSDSGRAKLLCTSGAMLQMRGGWDQAARRLHEATATARQAGDMPTLATTLGMQGYLAVIQGQARLGRTILEEAETLSRRLGDLFGATLAAAGKAVVSRRHLADADRLLAECEAEMRALRLPWSLAMTLTMHGWVALLLERYALAQDLLREAVVVLGRLQDLPALMHGLTLLADAAVRQSRPEQAAHLYGAADLLAERSGAKLFPFYQAFSEGCRASAAEQIGSNAFEALGLQGRALPVDALVALVAGAALTAGSRSSP